MRQNPLPKALLLVLVPIGILMGLAPSGGLSGRYLALNNWDSVHYRHIAEGGYRIPPGPKSAITSDSIHQGLANVVFFPGYPLAARAVAAATGASVPLALLLVAQASALVFWVYFFLLARAFGVSERAAWTGALALAFHPAAFYLVCAYTESPFLAAMLGFIYWSERRGFLAASVAGLHGFAMSSVRIVAFAPAAYPFFRRRGWREIALGLAGVSGAIVFFSYCAVHFGEWSLYFRLEEIGWQNHRRWFAILNPLSYLPRFFFEDSIESFNRLAVLVTGIQLVQSFRSERRLGWPNLALWLVAFALFYIPLTGKANANMDSMLRYTFPVFIFWTLIRLREGGPLVPWRRAWVVLVATFSVALQVWCAYRFLHGHWVA